MSISPPTGAERELVHYLVEVVRPEDGWQEIQSVATRAREAADELAQEGVPVRFLRSIFVPEDDACFFLYEGPTAAAVQEAASRAELCTEQVHETIAVERTEEQ